MVALKNVRVELPFDVTAARAARVALAALTANAEAQLVVGELVTNAVMHGAPPIRLSVTPQASGLRVAVHDGRPDLGPPGPDSRGIRLVDQFAREWGVEAVPDHGKVIWASLRL